jgi:hypothetical protein
VLREPSQSQRDTDVRNFVLRIIYVGCGNAAGSRDLHWGYTRLYRWTYKDSLCTNALRCCNIQGYWCENLTFVNLKGPWQLSHISLLLSITKYIPHHHGHFSTLLTSLCPLNFNFSVSSHLIKAQSRKLRGWRHSPGIHKRFRVLSPLGYYAMSPSRQSLT